jgi:hypothetical protein
MSRPDAADAADDRVTFEIGDGLLHLATLQAVGEFAFEDVGDDERDGVGTGTHAQDDQADQEEHVGRILESRRRLVADRRDRDRHVVEGLDPGLLEHEAKIEHSDHADAQNEHHGAGQSAVGLHARDSMAKLVKFPLSLALSFDSTLLRRDRAQDP